MNKAIVRQESLTFIRRGPAMFVVALLLLTLFYAGFSGDRWRDTQSQNLESFQAQAQDALDAFRTQLADIESGAVEPSPYDANPMSILFPATLPPAALADFAIGHADLHPASAEISTWRNQANVFGRYQFDNPTTLSSSAFDVAMIIVVLLPLVMIGVSFDVLARDRAQGALGMILAAPVALRDLVWTRLWFRNGIIWLTAAIAMVFLGIVNDDGGDRFNRLGIWLTISLVYLMFWLAMIAYCVARFRSAKAVMSSLVGAWLLFTLALPASIATLSEALYPTPSRLAFLSEIRTAQGDTNKNIAALTDGFMVDHPELTVGDEGLPSFYRAAFLSGEAARVNTKPIIEAYEAAWSGRDRTVRWAQYLSPAVIAQRLLHLSAGADLNRQYRFQAQVQRSLEKLGDDLGPYIVSRNRLPLAKFDELAPFEFDDVAASGIALGAIGPVMFLLVLTILAGIVADRRLRDETGHLA
ncbi:MAG: DUF3526 domain-containing protein [Pseudomonadota bacterium]